MTTRSGARYRNVKVLILACMAMSVLVAPASGGPSQGGFSSENVEWVRHVPVALGTAEGGRIVGNHLYLTTNQQGLLIFDLAEPEDPQLVGRLPLPHLLENEDVATNGDILLLSQFDLTTFAAYRPPTAILYVIDVEDKTDPRVIARVPGAGAHTYDCLFDCRWAYSGYGHVVDLRDPTHPKLFEESWLEAAGMTSFMHDVTEVAPGVVLTASEPMLLLKVGKDPVHPEVLARSDRSGNSWHNVVWPRRGRDKLVMSASEDIKPRCEGDTAMFKTWDASRWRKTRTFTPIAEYAPRDGTFVDGSPPVSATWYGCSAHWFQEHPKFRNGGLVAAAFFSHGVRFLEVSPHGDIEEIGHFLPHGGASSAAYWVTDEIVYSIDLDRGIDVLRFTGDVRTSIYSAVEHLTDERCLGRGELGVA